jgi:drug/metabolite transporter (DMT)-like permease
MSSQLSHVIGALCALGSAAAWAVSAILFQQLGRSMSALALNVGKGIVALLLMGAILLAQPWVVADARTIGLLAISGALGIAVGDTLYFMALTHLGSRTTLVFTTAIPIVTAIAAMLVFGESLSAHAWLGLALTLTGVTWVLWEQAPRDEQATEWRRGVLYAALFVAASAASILLTKAGVAELPSMQATFWRQLWALFTLFMVGGFMGAWLEWAQPLRRPRTLASVAVAAVIGGFLGTWLSVAALKYTEAAVATVLNATSPLFILPLAALWMRERITVNAIAGAAIAVSGVAVYFLTLHPTG